MKVLNLFASPGTGKSTTAAGLFFLMKHAGYKVELVTEYAKMLTWEKRDNILEDQLYILAKQNRALKRLIGQVDWAITDSPLLLGRVYSDADDEELQTFIWKCWASYDNINFLLERAKPYIQLGRSQTEEESRVIHTRIKHLLDINNISYQNVRADVRAPQVILDFIGKVV